MLLHLKIIKSTTSKNTNIKQNQEMPTKMDTTQNIKAYIRTQDKNTGKTIPMEQKGSATKNQNTNISMVKEASPNENKQKHKAIKDAEINKSPIDSSESVTPIPIPISTK